MSNDWDFYFARVNDAVSSIFVDLGVRADAPLEKGRAAYNYVRDTYETSKALEAHRQQYEGFAA